MALLRRSSAIIAVRLRAAAQRRRLTFEFQRRINLLAEGNK